VPHRRRDVYGERLRPERHEGLAPKSVRHVHTMLRKSLQDAVERGYLGRNVCDLANPPTQRDARGRRARDKAWTVDPLRTFLAHIADDRDYAPWLLIASTGMRRGEVCGLRWPGRFRRSYGVPEVVRERGLEPPPPFGDTALNYGSHRPSRAP
jgi:integrase